MADGGWCVVDDHGIVDGPFLSKAAADAALEFHDEECYLDYIRSV